MPDLTHRLLELISSDVPIDDELFNQLALELFAYQLASNPFLAQYARAWAREAPADWLQIPALPTSAFKRARIVSFPPEKAVTHFQTSGTTEGESGRHYFQSVQWYNAAILPNFRRYLMPSQDRMRMCILTPSAIEAPRSSLSHMMAVVKRDFGTSSSRFFIEEHRLRLDLLKEHLRSALAQEEPVFLLGTGFSFLLFIDELVASDEKFALPTGSRIMETGGFKGRTRELRREEFYPMLSEAFGIPLSSIVNEYGMTELSSQFYERSLVTRVSSARKAVPHWCRVKVVDPLTDRVLPYGEPGLIRIWDLANVGSAAVLQTEDVGITYSDGFEVLGRVATAQPRGCSLGAEVMLKGRR